MIGGSATAERQLNIVVQIVVLRDPIPAAVYGVKQPKVLEAGTQPQFGFADSLLAFVGLFDYVVILGRNIKRQLC